ncbi:hypothetical protein BDV93DRAFT_506749 [Ceratobasidium sp. AG-I]|nr:hypothetical protein BDV93DRAFT_506749 [Ceratobasidium sp. AG-I]
MTRSLIPTLEHVLGIGKVHIQIAVCSISKSWCQKYPEDFKKYAHLLNTKATSKPEIASFLDQHPEGSLDKKRNQQQSGWDGRSMRGDNTADRFDNWPVVYYDGDEESGAVVEMVAAHTRNILADTSERFLIDPVLISNNIHDTDNQLDQEAQFFMISDQAILEPPCTNNQSPCYAHATDMPPPLLLNLNRIPIVSEAPSQIGLPVSNVKKGKGDPTVNIGNQGPGPSSSTMTPTGKRRRCPPGSKNKPKPKLMSEPS